MTCPVVRSILDLLTARPATMGAAQLVCVDGRAGAGKTSLARDLARATSASVVALDAMYVGWGGLASVHEQAEPLLRSLAAGQPGTYRRYDWATGQQAEQHIVDLAALIILEGVGAGDRRWADLITTLVWVDTPDAVRRVRALGRDGETFAPWWQEWAKGEDAYLASDFAASAAVADIVVAG